MGKPRRKGRKGPKGPGRIELQDPSHLRHAFTEHGDMSSRRWQEHRRIFIGSMRYLPYALLKLIENVPMPWESVRMVNTLYHETSALTFVDEVPRVAPPRFIAAWGYMWHCMRQAKRDRENFRRVRIPVFDDEEPPLDFVSVIEGIDPLPPVGAESPLPEEDAAIAQWLLAPMHISTPPPRFWRPYAEPGADLRLTRRKWHIPLAFMSPLARYAALIATDSDDPNRHYMFDQTAFVNAKALGAMLPGGPKFEPLHGGGGAAAVVAAPSVSKQGGVGGGGARGAVAARDTNDDVDDFNTPAHIIVRAPMKSVYVVAYPYTYASDTRGVVAGLHHAGHSVVIQSDEGAEVLGDGDVAAAGGEGGGDDVYDAVAFHLDTLVHPVPRQLALGFREGREGSAAAAAAAARDPTTAARGGDPSREVVAVAAASGGVVIGGGGAAGAGPRQPLSEAEALSLCDVGDYDCDFARVCGVALDSDDIGLLGGPDALDRLLCGVPGSSAPAEVEGGEDVRSAAPSGPSDAQPRRALPPGFPSGFTTRRHKNAAVASRSTASSAASSLSSKPHGPSVSHPSACGSVLRPSPVAAFSGFRVQPASAFRSTQRRLAASSRSVSSASSVTVAQATQGVLGALPGHTLSLAPMNFTAGVLQHFSASPFNQRNGRTERPADIRLVDHWLEERTDPNEKLKVRVSAQRLLRDKVRGSLSAPPPRPRKRRRLLRALEQTSFFQRTRLDWLEAGLQLIRQAHTMVNLLVHRRGLLWLHLDYNFVLKPIRSITTKERKKSRFGAAFHLLRELCCLTKHVVDIHTRFRMRAIDAYQLADAMQHIFSHVGNVTRIFRFRYKLMRHIGLAKAMKHLIYARFNLELQKGPGVGFWQPLWRRWVLVMRGLAPILSKWIGNLLSRHFTGRQSEGLVKTMSKQRLESQYDIELRQSVLRAILETLPPEVRKTRTRALLQHLSEAWRCWKAGIEWNVAGMPPTATALINKYVALKAEWYTRTAQSNRVRIASGVPVDRTTQKKNQGRMSRLLMKDEQDRQTKYEEEGPYLQPAEAVAMYKMMAGWLSSRRFEKIAFPPLAYKYDQKLLVLALERLKESIGWKLILTQSERELLGIIEDAFDKPQDALARIKRQLLTQRTFKDVTFSLRDNLAHVVPMYSVNATEILTDAYLDQFVCFEAERRGLFPSWVKPMDDEPAPVLVHNFAAAVNNLQGVWGTEGGARTVLMETTLRDMHANIDLTLLNKMLRLIVDPAIADYMTARFNTKVTYKDMGYMNRYGIIRGIQFSPFVVQYWGLMLDLLLIGPQRAQALAGPATAPSSFGTFPTTAVEVSHPLRVYMRFLDRVYMVFRFSGKEVGALSMREEASASNEGGSVDQYPNKRSWPRNQRMKLTHADVVLARAVFNTFTGRIPRSVTTMVWGEGSAGGSGGGGGAGGTGGEHGSFVSVYSDVNEALLFSMCGFEVRLLPKCRAPGGVLPDSESALSIVSRQTSSVTAAAFLKVSPAMIRDFEQRIRLILMSSLSSSFQKLINRWNVCISAFVGYFREAILATPELMDVFIKSETRIQTRVKITINSKMPSRYPACVFYAPTELGGLGMLSIGHVLVPAEDVRYASTQGGDSGPQHFRAGMQGGGASNDATERIVPNIFRYIMPWGAEVLDSERAWADFRVRKEAAERDGRRLTFEEIEDLVDRGVPRVATAFGRDRQTLACDKLWRLRLEYLIFHDPKSNPLYWTHKRHDGTLWSLARYRADVVSVLGGVEAILDHTLFRACFFPSWDHLFWEKQASWEQTMAFRRLTKAQRQGLSQVPNRRFVMWWSPTINRASVYVGYEVTLPLMGVRMHGKLPMLKTEYIHLFRSHMWQKIHETLVTDMCKFFAAHSEDLGIEIVEKQVIHPRKSFKFDSSAADVVVRAASTWAFDGVSSLTGEKVSRTEDDSPASEYWIDIQLRWGDYDQHNADSHAKAKYFEYTTDGVTKYPSHVGLVVVFDLAYNLVSAYGHWLPKLKTKLTEALARILKANPGLYALRERVRKTLQLHTKEPTETPVQASNYQELVADSVTWVVDDSQAYRATMYQTFEGNTTTKPVNGAVLVLCPRSGQLLVSVIHTDEWAGQKKLATVARWKAAEAVLGLIKLFPSEDQKPKCVVTLRNHLKDPLSVQLFEYPGITIKDCALRLPTSSVLLLEQINDTVMRATKSKSLVVDMYDDWVSSGSIAPFTAFNRLILILRAHEVAYDRARRVLRPSHAITVADNHLWPTLSAAEWAKVELTLKDLILAAYSARHNVPVDGLSPTEIRDILLGADDPEAAAKAASIKALEQKGAAKGSVAQTLTQITTRTVNRHGQAIVSVTTTPYENEVFLSRADWRVRAAVAALLVETADRAVAADVRTSASAAMVGGGAPAANDGGASGTDGVAIDELGGDPRYAAARAIIAKSVATQRRTADATNVACGLHSVVACTPLDNLATVELPRSLLRSILAMCDPRTQVAVVLYGAPCEPSADPSHRPLAITGPHAAAVVEGARAVKNARGGVLRWRVVAAVVPPQWGTASSVSFCSLEIANGLERPTRGLVRLGVLHTTCVEATELMPQEAVVTAAALGLKSDKNGKGSMDEGEGGGGASAAGEVRSGLVLPSATVTMKEEGGTVPKGMCVRVLLSPSSVIVSGVRVSDEGLQWAADHRDLPTGPSEPSALVDMGWDGESFGEPLAVELSDDSAYTIVPKGGTWNRSFMPRLHEQTPWAAAVGPPAAFYDGRHRPMHFDTFVASGQAQTQGDLDGVDYEGA